MNEKISQLTDILQESDNIVFFGGAGVSTASNIPDFRSSNGLYSQKLGQNFTPEQLVSHTFFVRYPEEFFAFYKKNLVYPDAKPNACHIALAKLEEMGCVISRQENALTLHGPERLSAFAQLQTQPHPGFPTDMQAQMMAIASLAKGTSVVVENVFENRFAHAGDLNRMGANILINGRTAVIRGVERLSGARVTARDLRGGAALAIAGLAAQGETIVERARLIDRGYESLETALTHLGADVQRISVERGEEHP